MKWLKIKWHSYWWIYHAKKYHSHESKIDFPIYNNHIERMSYHARKLNVLQELI